MAISKQDFLSKFVKMTELEIDSAETEDSVDRNGQPINIVKLTLKTKKKVVGRNTLPTGAALVADSDTVYVAQDDIEKLYAGIDPETGNYKGDMKLDVSKPKFRTVGTNTEVVRAARIWLVSVTFDKRGASMRQNAQNGTFNLLKQLYGDGPNGAVSDKTTVSGVVPVDIASNEKVGG